MSHKNCGRFSLNSLILFSSLVVQTEKDIYAKSVDPDETARHQPSHLDLHCLPFFI